MLFVINYDLEEIVSLDEYFFWSSSQHFSSYNF